jgi:hypothetical protein
MRDFRTQQSRYRVSMGRENRVFSFNMYALGRMGFCGLITVTAANRFALLAFGQFRFAAGLDAPHLCTSDHRRRADQYNYDLCGVVGEKWDPTSMSFQTILNA